MLSLFSTIRLAYVLKINIFGKDYSNLRNLKKCNMDCKLKHLKTVTNGHRYTKTTEDEEVYVLNNYSH